MVCLYVRMTGTADIGGLIDTVCLPGRGQTSGADGQPGLDMIDMLGMSAPTLIRSQAIFGFYAPTAA